MVFYMLMIFERPGGRGFHTNHYLVWSISLQAQGVALTNTDMEVKTPDGKDPASIKKSKAASGNMGLISGKSGESGKAASVSGNDGASQRYANSRSIHASLDFCRCCFIFFLVAENWNSLCSLYLNSLKSVGRVVVRPHQMRLMRMLTKYVLPCSLFSSSKSLFVTCTWFSIIKRLF